MTISRTSLNAIPLSFASVSVGTPGDPLEEKLEAISSAGFRAIELGFPDLLSFAHSFHKKEIRKDDYENLCVAGNEVKKLCERHGLGIMMLQPFSNFEGWEKGSREREDAFARARGWIRIMRAVGTDMLQVIYFLFSSHLSSSESRSNRSDRSAHQILLISALTSMSLLRI
jgi:sugar phosphate isomerase/epimerase